MSKIYNVCVAYYDSDCRATVEVEADSYDDACREAIRMVNDGDVETQAETFDPGKSFAYGVVEGHGDPWKGEANVPADIAPPEDRAEHYATELRNLREAASAYDAAMDDTANGGKNARPPTGDDYNALLAIVLGDSEADPVREAAPELLAALARLAERIREQLDMNDDDDATTEDWRQALAAADAAIAKAEGK